MNHGTIIERSRAMASKFYGCSSCDRLVSSLLTDTCVLHLDVIHTLVAIFTIVTLFLWRNCCRQGNIDHSALLPFLWYAPCEVWAETKATVKPR